MDNLIRDIRTDLRLSMNGVVSSSMRDKGMAYKMNFGVDRPRIVALAEKYESDASAPLANKLWSLDVRELKILATMLYPLDEFNRAKADEWMHDVPNQEIRENLCRNLLQKLSFANELVQTWSAQPDEDIRLTGYWLLVRLMLIQSEALQSINMQPIVEEALRDIHSQNSLLSTAALNVLKQAIRRGLKEADYIMKQIAKFETSDNPTEIELYKDLQFEYKIR